MANVYGELIKNFKEPIAKIGEVLENFSKGYFALSGPLGFVKNYVEIIDKINSFFGYNCISKVKLKTIQSKIQEKNKVFPKIKNLGEVQEKIKKVKDENIKNSLNDLLKAYNERSF